MQTWTAKQIGDSNGAYSGRRISFTHEGLDVTGVLTRSDRIADGRTVLNVKGTTYFVSPEVVITVDPVIDTTAGKIGDDADKYSGKTVEFPDFHGRTITGPLEAANAPSHGMYADLTVQGRARGVFRNTPVKVDTEPEITLSPASEKRPCCGALNIQPHMPDCDGRIRSRGTGARF